MLWNPDCPKCGTELNELSSVDKLLESVATTDELRKRLTEEMYGCRACGYVGPPPPPLKPKNKMHWRCGRCDFRPGKVVTARKCSVGSHGGVGASWEEYGTCPACKGKAYVFFPVRILQGVLPLLPLLLLLGGLFLWIASCVAE